MPPLAAGRLCARGDPALFDFDDTAALPEPAPEFGQARAVEALRLGLAIEARGYNLFVLGPPGHGRHALVRRLLQAHALTRPPPSDWCYVNNFAEANKPRALKLPAGEGLRLRNAMQGFVAELGQAIEAALESDAYRSRIDEIQKAFKQHEEQSLQGLGDRAAAQGVGLLRTPQGFAFAPLKDGQPIAPPQFAELPEAERERVGRVVETLHEQLQQLTQALPRVRRESQARIREATRDAMALAAGHLIDELKAGFAGPPGVVAFLDAVLADVIDAGEQLKESSNGDDDDGTASGLAGSLSLLRYRVNLLVGHAPGAGAPVESLDHPTYANLVGRVDHVAHMGTLLTNFTLVRAGALQRANGGFLMLDAEAVLGQPYAWDGLKRALKSGQATIESLPQLLGWASTLPLEPEPIPLALKIVLFGEREHYYLLQQLDPEFGELFKVAADFEDSVARDAASSAHFARLLGAIARGHGLRPLARDAVARCVEQAARRAGDAGRLAMHTRSLADLLHEADHAAAAAGRAAIAGADVLQAVRARARRADRLRDETQEAVLRQTLRIATAGAQVGQVNGLAVVDLGEFRFGHPLRITATARPGEGELIDIERESELGGPLHSKGVMILAAFLGARYAQGLPLSLSASLVCEQSYGEIEGDSASLAELCALLSALAGVPLRQALAVTGSVDQLGRVQAVGGLDEKIEGFFDLCAARGLSGEQGVLVPRDNVGHLMLRDDVVEAAAAGRFHVWAVEQVDEAVTLLTGVPAGTPDLKGALPEGTVNDRVARRLAEMSRLRHELAVPEARHAGPGRSPAIRIRRGR